MSMKQLTPLPMKEPDGVIALEPKCTFRDLVLAEEVTDELADVLEDQMFREDLEADCLPVRKNILLFGPSGCGKTSIAHAIAARLHLKIQMASLSQLVQSHMGESAKRVEAVFKFAQHNNCVLLLDEFDAIAAARMPAGQGAESERNFTVNTLLTVMELHKPAGMLVACTNNLEHLDPAVLRRFDARIEINLPPRESLIRLAEKILDGRFSISAEECVGEATSPAIVEQRTMNLLRRRVIDRARALRKPPPKARPPAELAQEAMSFIKSLEKTK